MNNLTKMLVKVLNESTDREEWTHVCYVDKDLYTKFLEEKDCETSELNEYLSRWAREDFNYTVAMSSKNDILTLKGLVKDFYKRAHPELYINSPTDRQGWIRVWITKKLKEELGIYGKECF